MGYRSQVRSLIYGDPDKICALVAANALRGGVSVVSTFSKEGALTRYRLTRRLYDHAATAAQPKNENGGATAVYKEFEIEVLDLYGDDWKWYDDYPDVRAWSDLLDEAREMGLSTEFTRIGEDTDDTEWLIDVADEGDHYLFVRRIIEADIPESRPVNYESEVA